MKRKYLQLTIGILVSAFFIWFAFRAGGMTLREIGEAFAQTNWLWAIPTAIITIAGFYWRCLRWRILLREAKDIPSGRLFGPLMIGFAFNNIFPARAGEIARPIALYKQERVPIGAGLSTVVLERLVDVFTLLALLITMPLYVTLSDSISRDFTVGETVYTVNAEWLRGKLPILSAMAFVLFCGIVSFLVPPVRALYLGILARLPLLPGWVKEKLAGFIQSFADGCRCLQDVKALFWITFHSVVIWFSVAWSFQIMSWGFPGVNFGFGGALGLLVVTCLVISIPSSPGYWGIYEFGGMVALLMMGVVADTEAGAGAAFTFTLVVHAIQWIPITAIGLWYAAKLSITPSDVEEVEVTQEGNANGRSREETAQAEPQGESKAGAPRG